MDFFPVAAFFWAMLISPFMLKYENINPAFIDLYSGYMNVYKESCTRGGKLMGLKKIPPRIIMLFEPNGPDESSLAVCFRLGRTSRISVDPASWEEYGTDDARRQIIFHELSHCILKLEHNIEDNRNYMFPRIEVILDKDSLIKQVSTDMKEFCK